MATSTTLTARRLAVVAAITAGSFGTGTLGSPASVTAISPMAETDAAHVTADALPTVQINGVVWDQHIVGNRVYVVGSFSSARPAGAALGTNETPKANILAYDLTTGQLDTGFTASLNADGRTVTSSPDGSRIYVGGMFTVVNGINRYRIAALDPVTGAVITSFNAAVDYRVNVIAATNSTVYAGGAFNASNSIARPKLAAFTASNGALTAWAPTADAEVASMVISPDGSSVIVGGRFASLNGVQARGTGALDAVTGATLPWAMNDVIATYGTRASITELTTDGTSILGTAYHYGGTTTKFEGTFSADPTTGELNWINDCHGDSYATTAMNGYVYTVGHPHYCGTLGGFPQTQNWAQNMRQAISMTAHATGTLRPDTWDYVNFTGRPSPSIVNWFPDWQIGSYTSAGMAGWTVEGNGQYLIIGGEFLRVNNVPQQGLVRFAVPSVSTNSQGPRLGGSGYVPQLRSVAAGQVRISFPANWDRDQGALEYRIIRNGDNANPIYTTKVFSTYWNRPSIGFTDVGLTPGSTQTYRIRTSDAAGNVTWGDPVSVVVAGSGSPSTYADVVMDDRPTFHWRFNEPAGSSGAAADWMRGDDGVVNSGVTRGVAGALTNEPTNTAYNFNGTTSARVTQDGTAGLRPVLDTFTIEAWIRTTSSQGGRILGFSGSATGTSGSSNFDRHMYMANNGRVLFGVHPDSRYTVTSPGALNDGNWHHVVGTLGDTGLLLYVDGVLVASRADVLHGRPYYGVWRVGGDALTSWPSAPSNVNFNGSIDEAAVYEYNVLSPDRIAAHYAASGRTPALQPAPADAYGAAVYGEYPVLYYRLQDTPLSAADDAGIRDNDGDYLGTVGGSTAGVITGNSAVDVTGAGGVVASRNTFYAPAGYSLEGWFKTTTTTGGSLISLGSSRSGTSTTVSRQVLMTNAGRVAFRASHTDANARVMSGGAYNDGQWHHVAATHGSTGMRLYVDGALVAQNGVAVGQAALGYWRIGNDATSGLSTSASFVGALDEMVVYDRVLSSSTIADHLSLAGSTPPANVPPVAAFTHTANFLAVAFDGTGSTDPDGTIQSWSWNFGGGATATGPTANHTFPAAGTYNVTLTVTDNQGSTNSTTNAVTVTAQPPANVHPVAAFTHTANFLAVAFDGTGSTDPDGTIQSWSWNFGGGATATGPTANHTFPAAGTYNVTLTVTDNQGGTNSTTNAVTVTAQPPASTLASDDFDRAVTNGWGSATVGGSWTTTGSSSQYGVNGAAGTQRMGAPGTTTTAYLHSVSVADATVTVDISWDKSPTGGGVYASVVARRNGTSDYHARVRAMPTSTSLTLFRVVDGTATSIGAVSVPGLTYTAGDTFRIRFDVVGSTSTTLAAKLWKVGEAEPAGWHVSTTDATAALQVPGGFGLTSYLSGSTTNSPVTASFDDFSARSLDE